MSCAFCNLTNSATACRNGLSISPVIIFSLISASRTRKRNGVVRCKHCGFVEQLQTMRCKPVNSICKQVGLRPVRHQNARGLHLFYGAIDDGLCFEIEM